MKIALFLLALIAVGGLAWIRLAPSDPARWHVRLLPAGTVAPGIAESHFLAGKPGQIYAAQEGTGSSARLIFTTPQEALAALESLDRIALATPHTKRLTGSVGEGRITWITRSRLFGFPDYTTADVRGGYVDLSGARIRNGAELTLYARQRFGVKDFGVNAARLRDWLAQLSP